MGNTSFYSFRKLKAVNIEILFILLHTAETPSFVAKQISVIMSYDLIVFLFILSENRAHEMSKLRLLTLDQESQ